MLRLVVLSCTVATSLVLVFVLLLLTLQSLELLKLPPLFALIITRSVDFVCCFLSLLLLFLFYLAFSLLLLLLLLSLARSCRMRRRRPTMNKRATDTSATIDTRTMSTTSEAPATAAIYWLR